MANKIAQRRLERHSLFFHEETLRHIQSITGCCIATKYQLDEKNEFLIVNGIQISLAVFQAMVEVDPHVLWRFQRTKEFVVAIPYSEQEVIWMEKDLLKPPILIGKRKRK